MARPCPGLAGGRDATFAEPSVHRTLLPHWGATMHHVDDVAQIFPGMKHIQGFTPFKEKVEKHLQVRPCFPTPASLPAPPA
eukprot:gene6068-5931_t